MATAQQVSCCFSYVMYISVAKFDSFNISRDILDSVFFCFGGATNDVTTSLICIIRQYL